MMFIHGYEDLIPKVQYNEDTVRQFRLYHMKMICLGKYIDAMHLIPVRNVSRKEFARKRIASQSIRKRSITKETRQKLKKAS